MPTVVYSPLYQPAVCNPYAGCTVTTYRPFLGTYQTRLVPYTTYRPIYVPAITYQSCYAPCVDFGSYSCGVPAEGCTSCGVAPQQTPQVEQKPQETKAEKRTTEPNGLQPIPQPEVQLNSTPAAPVLRDPNDRTTGRPVVRQARVQPAAYSVPKAVDRNDGGWYPVD